jgi:hypothetical protein
MRGEISSKAVVLSAGGALVLIGGCMKKVGLALLLVAIINGPTPLSSVAHAGEPGDSHSGYAVASAGDVNGDGYEDILIGAPHGSSCIGDYAGRTYLIFGKEEGWVAEASLSASNTTFTGESEGYVAGYSVAAAGDVNGDGYDDILIGAWGMAGGKTHLILGKETGWPVCTSLSNADASFIGENGNDRSGYSVASAGDANGDGYDDILIGAPYNTHPGAVESGKTYLVLGRESGWQMDAELGGNATTASFLGEGGHDESGICVASAGDVNGDGYDDILIGAHMSDDGGYQSGQSYLILGRESGWAVNASLADADASFRGEKSYVNSGGSVAAAGDVNGDGFDDFLIGAHHEVDDEYYAGQTYLILGGNDTSWGMDTSLSDADASFWGEDSYDYAGYSVASAGDANNDGCDDILIGAWGDEDGGSNAGQTYLILGGNETSWTMDVDLSNADASFIGENAGDRSGHSVAAAGDVNGDGYDDVLIGSPYGTNASGDENGMTYLVFGKGAGWTMDTSLSASDAAFAGEHMVRCPADANEDSIIDGRDIIRCKKIILGLEEETCGADANVDGVVDGRDVIRIKKMILGIEA